MFTVRSLFPRYSPLDGDDAVHNFDYIVIGFLIVCMLTAAVKALALDEGRQPRWRSLWPIRYLFKL